MADEQGRFNTKAFLERLGVEEPRINILLDVGAQMLELQNQELVEYWLLLEPEGISAAVFFKGDDLSVLTKDPRGWHVEAFETSPYSQQLDRCVVYLDDAHTRGIDLKLPRNARAAITLGPKVREFARPLDILGLMLAQVTKDRLVQGAMQLRQLGHGQSVMFFAPPEVDNQICAAGRTPLQQNEIVSSVHIVLWVMHETCEDIRHFIPHWVQQGLDFASRSNALATYQRTSDAQILKEAWLSPESRTLEQLYARSHGNLELLRAGYEIPALRERLLLLGVDVLSNPNLEEEAEREVAHEAERESEIQRPPMAPPLKHALNEGLVHFVKTGVIDRNTKGLRPLLDLVDPGIWSRDLYATADFSHTVETSGKLSSYMRPVRWILSSDQGESSFLLVISPFEANELLPHIRKSDAVRLHVYRARVVQTSRSMSNLKFCAIPTIEDAQGEDAVDDILGWQVPSTGVLSQLNLFAGALYLDDYETYGENRSNLLDCMVTDTSLSAIGCLPWCRFSREL
jgi:hypothetical protein